MTVLSVLGIRECFVGLADLDRPRGQFQLSSGYFAGVRVGVDHTVAAIVMFCGGCIVATPAFKNLRCLCNVSKCQTLGDRGL